MTHHFKTLPGILLAACIITGVGANAQNVSDSIRINQIGFYPKAPKTAIILTDHAQKFTVKTTANKTVFTGTLTPSDKPDLSGKTIYAASFGVLQQPGNYVLNVPDVGYSYPFTISRNINQKVAAAVIKGYYYQRASVALPEKYAGKWARAAGHPDNEVLIHLPLLRISAPQGLSYQPLVAGMMQEILTFM